MNQERNWCFSHERRGSFVLEGGRFGAIVGEWFQTAMRKII